MLKDFKSLFAFYRNLKKETLLLGLLLSSSPSFAQLRSEARLFSDSFISSQFAATERTDYQFVGAHLQTDQKNGQPLQLDVRGGIAFGAPLLNYLNFREFYFQQALPDQQKLTIGRKLHSWSELDQVWNLGLWEPAFKWNPLSPDRQGLSGLFWEVEKEQVKVLIFASPLFIPDQGPSFEIDGGEFKRGNPWFRQPPATLRLFEEPTNIEYNIIRPPESEIVMQSSYGGYLELGEDEGFKAQLSYLYKPANQLSLGYTKVINTGTLAANVDVYPQVFYHSLAGVDAIYKKGPMRLAFSFNYDRPSREKTFSEPWTAPVYADAYLTSASFEFDFGRYQLSATQLEVVGGEVTESDEIMQSQKRTLNTRYLYTSALQLALKTHHGFARGRSFSSQFAYITSQKDGFSLIRASGVAKISQFWSFFGEVQFVKQDKDLLDVQSEILQYANNDRFMLGVAYVF